jgi:hypothetical protein
MISPNFCCTVATVGHFSHRSDPVRKWVGALPVPLATKDCQYLTIYMNMFIVVAYVVSSRHPAAVPLVAASKGTSEGIALEECSSHGSKRTAAARCAPSPVGARQHLQGCPPFTGTMLGRLSVSPHTYGRAHVGTRARTRTRTHACTRAQVTSQRGQRHTGTPERRSTRASASPAGTPSERHSRSAAASPNGAASPSPKARKKLNLGKQVNK